MRRHGRSGLAMLAALMVLGFLGLLGAALCARHAMLRREVDEAVRRTQARELAESGLALARVSLARDPAWPGTGAVAVPMAAGEFSVRVDRSGIVSEGRVQGRPRPARVVLKEALPVRP